MVPLLLVSKFTPSDVIEACCSCKRGGDIVSSGRDIVMPGFGPRGSLPHSCTSERNLSCAIVSLKIMANAETMFALSCLVE